MNEIETALHQPFKGIVIEIVRTWHDHGGQRVADHRYRARRGTTIIASGTTHDQVCAIVAGLNRRQSQPVAKAPSATWLERIVGK